MAISVEVEKGVSDMWPALARDAPLLASPGWLQAMDGRLGPRPLTFVVRQDDAPVAAAYASVQDAGRPGEFFDPHHVLIAPTADFPLTSTARAARTELSLAAPAPQAWLPTLVVMLPGYECLPVGPAAGNPATLAALISAALDWAADESIPTVAFLYTRPDQTGLIGALRDAEFTEVALTYTWDLPLPGVGIDDYLSALPTKRRNETRREARRLADAGVRIHPGEIKPNFNELVRLRSALVTKYRGEADPVREAVRLRTLVDVVAGGRPMLMIAEADDTMLGFALFGPDRQGWLCLAVGCDYDDPRHRLTYFGTAYYQAAQAAYTAGVSSIGYGQGAWQAKRARGCRPTLMTGWVHSRDPSLAAAARASAAVTELMTL